MRSYIYFFAFFSFFCVIWSILAILRFFRLFSPKFPKNNFSAWDHILFFTIFFIFLVTRSEFLFWILIFDFVFEFLFLDLDFEFCDNFSVISGNGSFVHSWAGPDALASRECHYQIVFSLIFGIIFPLFIL